MSRWDNGSLDLARGDDGQLYAAWTEYEGALRLSRSVDGGQSFSKPLHIAGGQETPARAPTLAVASDSTVYLAWTVGENAAADIYFATSKDGSTSFGTPRIAAETTGHSDAPSLAVDADGVVHLVYGESPGGPFNQYHVAYTRRASDDLGFEEPTIISSTDEGANFPSLAVDADNRLYVLWEHFPRPGQRPSGLGFTYTDGEEHRFQAPTIIANTIENPPSFNGNLQGNLARKLAVENGTLSVVHSFFRPEQESRVQLIRAVVEGE